MREDDMSSAGIQTTNVPWQWRIWRQWIAANAFSETIGLGGTLLIGILLLANAEHTIGTVLAAALAVAAGTLIEGLCVGTAQWLVLRRPLRKMRWRTWAVATATGACIAWTLGMVPSTFMFNGSSSGSEGPGAMSDLMIYALAAGMGLVLGAILGLPQWLALRRYLPNAGWWVLANALAWTLGMVVIFIGTSFIPASGFTWQIAILLLLFVVAAGAVVGVVHGWFFIWLLRRMNPHSYHDALPSLLR